MISGRLGDASGRPYVEGRLFIPRLGLRSDISFIVDTGADHSLLMPMDGQRMKLDYNTLNAGVESRGVGGISRNFSEQAILAFSEPGRFIHVYVITLQIAPPSPDIIDIPSLLGRDVLDRWIMTYNPKGKRLTFKVLSADHTIPIPKGRIQP